MATDSFNLGIPLPADSTKISEFPAVTRRGLERVAEVLAGGMTDAATEVVRGLAGDAVGKAITTADIATFSSGAPAEDVEGGMLDKNGRSTWLTHDGSGGPTEYARTRLGIIARDARGIAGGFLDKTERPTWLTHDGSGGPTDYALGRLRAALNLDDTTAPATPATPASAAGHRHAMLENEMRVAYGGTIRTGGAAPVVFICDHGVNKFRDILLPLLTARNLPSVLALNGNMHKSGYNIEAESANVPWTEINNWPSVEIANHGATHTTKAVAEGQLETEIIGSLADLKKNLPAKKILTWVQPAIDFPGFSDGRTTENWTDTTAGRLIYENHAVATGTMRAPGHPLIPRDGHPLQGMVGVWIDGAGAAATVKNQIRAAATAGHGIIIRHHPRTIDADGMITTAEITAFIDFLKTEQDAGRIRVLNLSQWSLADTGN